MKKLYIIILSLIFVSLSLSACKSKNNKILTTDDITHLFTSSGYNCETTEIEMSRSENFPFRGDIKVLKINEAEIFLFFYKNEKNVRQEISKDFLTEKGAVFYINNVIFLYRGDDNKILNVLKSNLLECGEK